VLELGFEPHSEMGRARGSRIRHVWLLQPQTPVSSFYSRLFWLLVSLGENLTKASLSMEAAFGGHT
jgi:hypothetical protein